MVAEEVVGVVVVADMEVSGAFINTAIYDDQT